ncbi:hypothetical protein [Microbacterium sp. 13-71-7]|uniref:hypothetical protein n=1 Tax=Microbacterium sp. 13-71-7 TaxID=1970399 RepID=UPI0025F67116|nr:hypothetical protein [Microbacterium sp. 13-71-7]
MTPSTLNDEVQRELQRGSRHGALLPSRDWTILNRIESDHGVDELTLLAPEHRLDILHAPRVRRIVKRLVKRGFVRRDATRLLPTVAGVGAVHPFMSVNSGSSLYPKLRQMLAEEKVIGARRN